MPGTQPVTREQAESLERELDALYREVRADLGQRDVDHIRQVFRIVRFTEASGRALLHFGIGPITFVAGVAALGAAKIIENLEIGHNVMHGQYDWTGDPALDGRRYEWDTVSPSDAWRYWHNYE